MTRRTLLVPLFAAGLILAPAEISGQVMGSVVTDGVFQVAEAVPHPTSPPRPPSPIAPPSAGRGGS